MDDLISRQAVLDAMYELCNTGETLKENPWRDNPHIDAITDVINNLPSVNPQEPTDTWSIKDVADTFKKHGLIVEQEPCEDAVSRQMVKEQMIKYGFHAPDITVTEFVEDLPPATPQQKTGRWRHYEGMLICSKCGAEFYDDIMEYCGDDVPKCCPDCGAKMEVEE